MYKTIRQGGSGTPQYIHMFILFILSTAFRKTILSVDFLSSLMKNMPRCNKIEPLNCKIRWKGWGFRIGKMAPVSFFHGIFYSGILCHDILEREKYLWSFISPKICLPFYTMEKQDWGHFLNLKSSNLIAAFCKPDCKVWSVVNFISGKWPPSDF